MAMILSAADVFPTFFFKVFFQDPEKKFAGSVVVPDLISQRFE